MMSAPRLCSKSCPVQMPLPGLPGSTPLTRVERGNRMRRMVILDFSPHTGGRLAEVGFLLILIAGVWLAVAQIPQFRFGTSATFRTGVAGVALALGGLLLIIATHWGHFG